jgi:hypothetical protein
MSKYSVIYCTGTKYIEYHSVCPLVGIGTILPRGAGVNLLAGEGVGESQFRRLEKILALSLICGHRSGERK